MFLSYRNLSESFSLTHSQPDCWRGSGAGAVLKALSLSTRRKSAGTSNREASSAPERNSTTSEPQVDTRVLGVPRSLISLCTVVLNLTGKPGSSPTRWTSILSTLVRQFPPMPLNTVEATTTPPRPFFVWLHSGIRYVSTYQPP